MKKEDELTNQMKAIAGLSRDMIKSEVDKLPYKLDIHLSESRACIKCSPEEVDEWVERIKNENPTQQYLEWRYYECYLIPISTDNPT